MKSSDPHKNDLVDIKSFIDNGWYAYGVTYDPFFDVSPPPFELNKFAYQITLDSNDDPIVVDTVFTLAEICKNAHLKIENVYFNETFYTVYLSPPYDGID